MSAKCYWDYTADPGSCAYPDCHNITRAVCVLHPQDGLVCHVHRPWHRRNWVKKKFEIDSRPLAAVAPDSSVLGTAVERGGERVPAAQTPALLEHPQVHLHKRRERALTEAVHQRELTLPNHQGNATPSGCPKCRGDDLLLVFTLEEGNGKMSYSYACPSCGNSWPYPEE